MLLFLLAESERERALAEWRWGIMLILFIGIATLLIMLFAFGLRRWKRRQLNLIEQQKVERKQARSTGRVDAWQASAERYVDQDKLTEGQPSDSSAEDIDEAQAYSDPEQGEPEEEKDPYGLFEQMPYQEPEDEDDFDGDEDEDEDEDGDEDGDWEEGEDNNR